MLHTKVGDSHSKITLFRYCIPHITTIKLWHIFHQEISNLESKLNMTICATVDSARTLSCRDGDAAATLKFISMFVIFFTSIIGISAPVMLARIFHGKESYDKAILIIKCFAAGVILSTSLVHVLPDAYDALADCQVSSQHPWKDFPFSGLVTLVGVLMALLVDLTATSHVDGYSHGHGNEEVKGYKRIRDGEELKKSGCGDGEELKKSEVVVIETAEAVEERQRLKEEEMVKMKQRMVSQVF